MELSQKDFTVIRATARWYANRYPFLDADDLFQEGVICALLLRRRGSYRTTVGTWKTYMRACVRNVYLSLARNYLCRKKTLEAYTQRGHTPLEGTNVISPEERTMQSQMRARLVLLTKRLSPLQGKVIRLELDGYEDEEIGVQVGHAPRTVQYARRNALQRLRRIAA